MANRKKRRKEQPVGHERGDYTTMNEEKKLNMPQSLLLLLLIIGSVAVCIRLKTGGPMIGLFLSWIIQVNVFCGDFTALHIVIFHSHLILGQGTCLV